jgi:hypothetical protein
MALKSVESSFQNSKNLLKVITFKQEASARCKLGNFKNLKISPEANMLLHVFLAIIFRPIH